MAPPDGGGTGRHPIRVGAGFLRAPAGERSSPLQHIRAVRRHVRDAAPYEMGRGRHIWRPYTALPAYLSVGPRYIAAAHTCAEVWRRCGAPAEAQRSTRKGYAVSVRRQSERPGACGEAVTLRVGRMAGSLSPGSAKNAAPGCTRRSAPSGLLTAAPRFSFGNFHKSFSESY